MATDDDDPSLVGLLERLPISATERARFYRTDAEAVAANVLLLTVAAYFFNAYGVLDFGGRPGAVRDRRLVEQVVAVAFQTYGEVDPHPGPFDKAAMLLRGITQGHPFNDGNKRTGFLVAAYYLKIMGHSPPATYATADVVDFSVRVSAGEIRDVGVIAREIERLWSPRERGSR